MTFLYLLFKKKMAFTFPLFTQDVLLPMEDIVTPSNVIVEY